MYPWVASLRYWMTASRLQGVTCQYETRPESPDAEDGLTGASVAVFIRQLCKSLDAVGCWLYRSGAGSDAEVDATGQTSGPYVVADLPGESA